MKKICIFSCLVLIFLLISFCYAETRNIVPRAGNEGSIGTTNKPWADGWFATLHVDGSPIQTGAWTPSSRICTSSSNDVLKTDYLIWMDSEVAGVPQTLYFPDMETESQTIIVRHLGGSYPTILMRGTNTFELNGDGASIAVDWLGAKTNWYWRYSY